MISDLGLKLAVLGKIYTINVLSQHVKDLVLKGLSLFDKNVGRVGGVGRKWRFLDYFLGVGVRRNNYILEL